MADNQIPLSYVVNASVVPASRGLEPLQLGTILLLTDDVPVNALTGDYIIARTGTSIGQTFGTETLTAQMGNTIFSQNPNILNADGYVIVAPYLANAVLVPATSGTLLTVNLAENMANIKTVADGDLTLVVNGSNQVLTGLDFTTAVTLEDIANVIEEAVTGVTVTVSNNALQFESDMTGSTSTVEMQATVDGTGTDVYGTSYLNGASAVGVAGVDAVTGLETTSQAIQRLAGQIYFQGVLSARYLSTSEAVEASLTVEVMPNTMLFLTDVSTSTFASGGLFNQIQNNKHTRKLLYLTGETTDAMRLNAKLFATAFASRGLSVNYNGSNSTLTMTYKDLAGVPVDTNITETILAQCETYGADVYCSIEGLPKVISFKQGGLYFDQLANQIWLRTTIQTTVANVLFTTRTKIPQTTAGVTTLVNAVQSVLNQGVINGMIGAGEWNSPDTFGVYDDFIRGIRTFGYYVYFTPLAEQSQADREARKCPVISVACKEAGAIEHANILIYVEA